MAAEAVLAMEVDSEVGAVEAEKATAVAVVTELVVSEAEARAQVEEAKVVAAMKAAVDSVGVAAVDLAQAAVGMAAAAKRGWGAMVGTAAEVAARAD